MFMLLFGCIVVVYTGASSDIRGVVVCVGVTYDVFIAVCVICVAVVDVVVYCVADVSDDGVIAVCCCCLCYVMFACAGVGGDGAVVVYFGVAIAGVDCCIVRVICAIVMSAECVSRCALCYGCYFCCVYCGCCYE